ncbi:MAG: TonB family protein [bacterium]|nr:TonB family protein [bacterium]
MVFKDKIFIQALVLSLVWHLAGFFVISVRKDPFYLRQRIPVEISLAGMPLTMDKPEITDILSESDYSLFSMPSRSGFSKKVLDSQIEFEHQMVIWDNEPQSLKSRGRKLPSSVTEVLPKPEFNIKLGLEFKDVFAPSVAGGKSSVDFISAAVKTNSLISGPLEGREIIKVEYPDSPADFKDYSRLNMIRLKFWVTPAGEVKYVIVEKSCGNKEMDQLWVNAVQNWIFKENKMTDSLQWGSIDTHPVIINK